MTRLEVSLVRAGVISIAAGIGYFSVARGNVTLAVVLYLFALLFYIFGTNNPATLYPVMKN